MVAPYDTHSRRNGYKVSSAIEVSGEWMCVELAEDWRVVMLCGITH